MLLTTALSLVLTAITAFAAPAADAVVDLDARATVTAGPPQFSMLVFFTFIQRSCPHLSSAPVLVLTALVALPDPHSTS